MGERLFADRRFGLTIVNMVHPQAIIQPRVLLRSALMAGGMSADDIRRRVRRKEWATVRPGAYIRPVELKALNDRDRHLVLIAATTPNLPADAVYSHASAAQLHGISLWAPSLRTVQVTRPGSGGGHRRRTVHTFRAGLDPADIVTVNGFRATSPTRTIVDLARHLPFEQAVVAADSALHAGLTTLDLLLTEISSGARRPGMCRAREVIGFSEAQTESVGESRSRVAIWRGGLPMPEPQFRIRTKAGDILARSDFGWDEHRTVGEFDGAQKYGRLLIPGETPGDKIYQEKLREDRIRDEGWQVVRWTWDELRDGNTVVERIVRALERGGRLG